MIAALLSRRLRKWALVTVATPVARYALDQVADELVRRRGEQDRAVRTLRRASGVLDGVSRRGRRGSRSAPPR
ncbi:MAG TPA: hypothetical protein VNA12_06090 [Mycobacteriales bacterium]|nr:hypothetical protein [Mycobacteriales bacterium]